MDPMDTAPADTADDVRPNARRFTALGPVVVSRLTPLDPHAGDDEHVAALRPLVGPGEVERYEWAYDLVALGWTEVAAENLVERAAGIQCGHCKRRHMRVEWVALCADFGAAGADDQHFCESPSCSLTRGCVAYAYDSAAAGYWGNREEETERALWAIEGARARGEVAEISAGTVPPPFGW